MHLRPIEDNRINSRTSASWSIYLHTGIRQWLLSCVVILCYLRSCLRQTQPQSTQGHGNTETLLSNKQDLCICLWIPMPLCIHSVRASQRAQTGIVQSLLSEAAQRKHRVTASQNKCQRISLSCWCLHRLSGNRTIQVHTVCFSVVAFMGCHQWCLSHQSSWNSTTHHCSFEQLKNKVKNTSTSRTSQVFPNFGRTCRD